MMWAHVVKPHVLAINSKKSACVIFQILGTWHLHVYTIKSGKHPWIIRVIIYNLYNNNMTVYKELELGNINNYKYVFLT